MRELISNASDACDKLRYLAQSDAKLIADDPLFEITVKVDKDKRQIIIRDNGKSGTGNFLNSLSGDAKKDSMLIGQFGVGFYSAFMVADSITVSSRKVGEEKAYV